jgi:hypothetical protein
VRWARPSGETRWLNGCSRSVWRGLLEGDAIRTFLHTSMCTPAALWSHGALTLASWAAMQYTHHLMIGSMPKDETTARTKRTRVELQRAIDAHPTVATAPPRHDPSCLDERF